MMGFLLQSDERGSGPFADAYVAALKDAFLNSSVVAETPAAPVNAIGDDRELPIWRLQRIEAEGFGGVNAHDGQKFVLDIAGDSFCVDGYNGQGKTSLASILAVGLTGQRFGLHGPSPAACLPSAVRSSVNRTTTSRWPSAVAYPATFEELSITEPRAKVRLGFADQSGETHIIDAEITERGFNPSRPHLPPGVPELLVELAILMPNRISHLRIDEDTRLVEVLVQLIGLDPLRAMGEHVMALCHGSKNFAGSPRTADIKKAKDTLIAALRQLSVPNPMLTGTLDASELLKNVQADIDIDEALDRTIEKLRDKKTVLFAAVTVDVSLDLAKWEHQAQLQQSVGRLRTKLDARNLGTLPAMQFLRKLNALNRPEVLDAVENAAATAELALQNAERDRERQLTDRRLRLKAAAAEWHREQHPQDSPVDECPLCERALTDDSTLRKLGVEIRELRRDAERMRRTFGEACAVSRTDLARTLAELEAPATLPQDPLMDFADQFSAMLRDDSDLDLMLSRPRQHALDEIATQIARLPPAPSLHSMTTMAAVPQEAELRMAIAEARRLAALIVWWPTVQPGLAALREGTLGKQDEQGVWTQDTLGAALEHLLALVAAAAPIDEALRHIEAARQAGATLTALRAERLLRSRIVDAIEPLKGLASLVDDEARTALSEVASITRRWFSDVYYASTLELEGAAITRKGVLEIEGVLGGVLLDATLVANTSWLRAFLWAFVFALRQHTIERLGHNPFPLLLLDDPQATFDNSHERQWAILLARMTSGTAPPETTAQLFVTSHDPKLFDLMAQYGEYSGRRAAVHGLDMTTGCLRVLDGTAPERDWAAFQVDRRPETAQNYIAGVRILVEARLALILHAFGIVVPRAQLNSLINEIDRRKDWPYYSSGPIRDLIDMLRIEKGFRETLNASHHAEDRHKLSEPDAKRVHECWSKLRNILELAGAEVRRLEFFGPRKLPLEAGRADSARVIRLPVTARVKPARLTVQGKVAAATDGRVSLGTDATAHALGFPNHGAVRLLADTLSPVASVGDILLIRLYHEPRDGDLVVAEVGGVLRARRVRFVDGDPEQAVLIATGEAPLATPPPIIVRPSPNGMRIIDGVLHERRRWTADHSLPGEAGETTEEIDLTAYCGTGSSIWQVSGDSASPVALDGQFLLVGSPTSSREAVMSFDGEMVLAEVESTADEPERYLKRLRWTPAMVVLESIENGGNYPPVLCSPHSKGLFPTLLRVAKVNGILFGPSKS